MKALSLLAVFVSLSSAQAATFTKIESMKDSNIASLVGDFDGVLAELQEGATIDTPEWNRVDVAYRYGSADGAETEKLVKQLAYKIGYGADNAVSNVRAEAVNDGEAVAAGAQAFGALSFVDNPETSFEAFGESVAAAIDGKKKISLYAVTIERAFSSTSALVIVDSAAREILVLGTTATE